MSSSAARAASRHVSIASRDHGGLKHVNSSMHAVLNAISKGSLPCRSTELHIHGTRLQLQVGCVLTDMAGVAHAEQARWML